LNAVHLPVTMPNTLEGLYLLSVIIIIIIIIIIISISQVKELNLKEVK
jgi:hypothetical protein